MAEEGNPAPDGANGEQPRKRRSRRRRRPPARTRASKATAKKAKGQPPAAASPPRGSVQKEISAGGVVYRRSGDVLEVVLASRRTRRGDLAWGLAKGGVEEGESMEQAAVREVLEETGLTVEVESSLGETKYFYVWGDARIRKTVHFFLMRHTGGDPEDRDDEMEEVGWFPMERALKRAAYRGEREILERAAELLR
jgi:8-oxo-dGTP pyrophosphatase MutT (NUDIX family)